MKSSHSFFLVVRFSLRISSIDLFFRSVCLIWFFFFWVRIRSRIHHQIPVKSLAPRLFNSMCTSPSVWNYRPFSKPGFRRDRLYHRFSFVLLSQTWKCKTIVDHWNPCCSVDIFSISQSRFFSLQDLNICEIEEDLIFILLFAVGDDQPTNILVIVWNLVIKNDHRFLTRMKQDSRLFYQDFDQTILTSETFSIDRSGDSPSAMKRDPFSSVQSVQISMQIQVEIALKVRSLLYVVELFRCVFFSQSMFQDELISDRSWGPAVKVWKGADGSVRCRHQKVCCKRILRALFRADQDRLQRASMRQER